MAEDKLEVIIGWRAHGAREVAQATQVFVCPESADGPAEMHIATGWLSKSVTSQIHSSDSAAASCHLQHPSTCGLCFLIVHHGRLVLISPWLLSLFLALSFTWSDIKQSLNTKIQFRFTFILSTFIQELLLAPALCSFCLLSRDSVQENESKTRELYITLFLLYNMKNKTSIWTK